MAYNFLNFSTYCRFEIQTTIYIEIEIYDIVVKKVRNLIEGKKN